jgi:hypothetical protein
MPSPVYSAGTPGNLVNGISVAKGATIAAFLDVSTCIEGQVSCEMTTGTTAPTAGTVFSAYKVYGNSAANTISASVAAGATSLSFSSSAGLHNGQKILLQQATSTKLGELVTITGSISGTGPYTVPVSATINSYSVGDAVYLIDQIATATATPSSTTGTWAASTDYSTALFLGTSQWAIAANNTDSAQTVTVTASVDKITAYQ